MKSRVKELQCRANDARRDRTAKPLTTDVMRTRADRITDDLDASRHRHLVKINGLKWEKWLKDNGDGDKYSGFQIIKIWFSIKRRIQIFLLVSFRFVLFGYFLFVPEFPLYYHRRIRTQHVRDIVYCQHNTVDIIRPTKQHKYRIHFHATFCRSATRKRLASLLYARLSVALVYW